MSTSEDNLEFTNNPLLDEESVDSESSDTVIVNKVSNKTEKSSTEQVAAEADPASYPSVSPSPSPAAVSPDSASSSKLSGKKKNKVLPNIQFAPLKIPMTRRRQTAAIALHFALPWIFSAIFLALLRWGNNYIRALLIIYSLWLHFFAQFPRRGGFRSEWFRNLPCFKWFIDYFPLHLHKTAELPADKSYVFGFHPHGIISFSGFGNFATNGNNFRQLFPGIKLHLLTLATNFLFPFFGFYLALLGVCDASRGSCNYILRQGKGNSILLVLGGAKESLDAHPSAQTGQYILTLKNRKGFVKVALENGASLVPVFSFGENDIYDQVANPRGSSLRAWQSKLQKKLGFAVPLIKGRGIFNYSFGLLPQRKPIHTYVGKPIDLPKTARDKIDQALIDKYHKQYMEELVALFETYKSQHELNPNAKITFVDDDELPY
jgi:2-acylglycerol O-acyltransferase 2